MSKAAIAKAGGKVRVAQHNEEQAKGLAKDIIASHGKDALKEVGRRLDRSAQYDRSVQGRDWQPSQQTNNLVAAKEHVQKHFEKAGVAKTADARQEQLFRIAGKSNAAQLKMGDRITKNAPRPGYYKASENKRLAKVQEPLQAREAILSARHGKIVAAQMKATESPATTRAIEHAKAAQKPKRKKG